MDWKTAGLTLFLLITLIAAPVAAQSDTNAIKNSFEAQCDVAGNSAAIEVGDKPYNITLNGEVVERIECGNLNAYSYPEMESSTANQGGLNTPGLIIGLIPLVALVGLSVYLSHAYQIQLDEGLVLIASSAVSFSVGAGAAIGLGTLSSMLWPLQILALGAGLLTPAALIFLNENIEEDDVKLRLLVTVLTTLGFLISSLILMVFSYTSL